MKRVPQKFKVTHVFLDGREIADEDFVPERDLTPEQIERLVTIAEECLEILAIKNA